MWTFQDETEIANVSIDSGVLWATNVFGVTNCVDTATGLICSTIAARDHRFIPGGPILALADHSCSITSGEVCHDNCPVSPFCDPEDPECYKQALVYRTDLRTGQVAWHCYVQAAVDSVAVDGSNIYFACQDCKIKQVDLRTGLLTWMCPHPGIVYDVHYCNNHLYTSTSDGTVRKLRVSV